MSKCMLFLVLLCLCAGLCPSNSAPNGTKCEPIEGAPTCVCKHPQGVIDLTKIANFDGNARFRNVGPVAGFVYDYNPCYPCDMFKDSIVPCSDVHVCQKTVRVPFTIYTIADAKTEEIYIHELGFTYVYYIGPANNGDIRETMVRLVCDENLKTGEEIITTTGDSEITLLYNFTLISLHACPIPPVPRRCEPVEGAPTCVCKHPHGVIDLTKIANFDGTPRFTGLRVPGSPLHMYDYNPCAPFTGQGECTNIHVCHNYNNISYTGLANYGTEEIWIGEDGPYVNYTEPGPYTRKVYVDLICEPTQIEPEVTTTGNSGENIRIFRFKVVSCHACPGGCHTGKEVELEFAETYYKETEN